MHFLVENERCNPKWSVKKTPAILMTVAKKFVFLKRHTANFSGLKLNETETSLVYICHALTGHRRNQTSFEAFIN